MFKKGDFIRRVDGVGRIYKILQFKEYVDLHQESLTVLLRLDNNTKVSVPTFYIAYDGWVLVNPEELNLIRLLDL